MAKNISSNKRIAKNTLLLYVRMFAMMGVSLYTSRVVLQTLGVDDFGLYNIVAGVVVFFSILNGALSSSTQRFLNFEMGKNCEENVKKVFKCSLSLHFILIGVVFVLAETLGLWYLNIMMNVPEGRLSAANWIYQFSIVTFCLNIFRAPFNAAIIAHERMNFYAYASIVEALLKLVVVYLLSLVSVDKLILYGFLIMLVSVLINQSYILYCLKKFRNIKLGFLWDVDRIKSMMSFSGWSLFGSVAVVCNQHGVNLILNYFCGVAINAAAGVAGQMTSAMYGFISNFQVAFNPQIVKLYAQNERDSFIRLVFSASKYSFLLFWLISLPVLFTSPVILKMWLGIVPNHAVSFCRIIILYLLVDALNGPLWTAANATGKIKGYQILMSSILICNIPVVFMLLFLGFDAEFAWLSKLFFNIFAMIARLLYLKKNISFPLSKYAEAVLCPLSLVVIVSLIPSFLLGEATSLIDTFIHVVESVLLVLLCSFFVALSKDERLTVVRVIKQRFDNET